MISNRLPPTPTVENILTIMRRIGRGDIRVPAFQRDFVWTEAQVIALFESIYKGFPVGSVLLWSVDEPILREAEYTVSVFPVTPLPKVWSYVLDGMQRLTAIYGVLNYLEHASDQRLNITFDIRDEKFNHFDSLGLADREFNMPLRALFAGKELLTWQSKILSMDGGDALFDKVVNLQAIFQEYMIPIVTITRDDVSSVVEMFERINNTGTRLDTVDFMRAVTWSNNFDLNASMERINATLGDVNFEISEQTLVKILGLELGREPMPDTLLTLRSETSVALNDAVIAIAHRLTVTAELFRERMRIFSSEYVPYEGQLLVVYRALQQHQNDLDDEIFKSVERWFWAIGFNESLRGKPDHYVARAVKSLDDLLAGKIRGVEPRLELQPRNFRERRFIQGKALSGAVAGIFAKNSPRSLITGDPINVESFMIDFSAAHFNSLIGLADISAAIGQAAPSAKVIANIYVSDHTQRNESVDRERALQHILSGAVSSDVLKSQLLNDACVEHLRNGEFSRFLDERAALMWSEAEKMIGA
ncbi:DUF262 domain-containing protein [Rhizobium bangladeshense]|uniref:DUF262 domain-containing protein n=1 Tax=Rhizobium bangladeshense TaxID=1138189 RepID=UPI001C828F83|nr:DUF262 domain-containing protein [Rhizobium bangladeshense]MBX4890652.1 DUF262 domain-containing protein [Rhizobium bangladeshense]